MVKENQNIALINQDDIGQNDLFHLKNCLISTIDLNFVFELKVLVILENCIVNNLEIHSCWFVNGFTIKNCIIENYVDYQMGGHNDAPIVFQGNVFNDFFNFFDCQFQNIIEVKDNVFRKGTNLLGNKGEGYENTFQNGYVVENNSGSIDLDQ